MRSFDHYDQSRRLCNLCDVLEDWKSCASDTKLELVREARFEDLLAVLSVFCFRLYTK